MIAGWEWASAAFNSLLLQIIVQPLFALMRVCFNLFKAIATINLFSEDIYEKLTGRVQSIVAVVMLFVIAYQIVLLIINPDGDSKKIGNIAKDILISFVLILICPIIFRYAGTVQNHVISDNVIPQIITGNKGSSTDAKGFQMVKIVFTSFFYPTGTSYSDFYDSETGAFVGDVGACTTKVSESGSSNAQEICENYIDGLSKAEELGPNSSIFDAFWGKKRILTKYDGDNGFTCNSVMMIIAGVYLIWLFLSYSLDLGVRAVKLFALEVIAPVPIMLRILPKSKATFDKWVKETLKTFLEVFIRLAFIFLIIELCTMVPTFVKTVLSDNNASSYKAAVTIILILGISKFAKDAPTMMKNVFNTGSDLFKDINLKGGVRERIKENSAPIRDAVTHAGHAIARTGNVIGGVAGGVKGGSLAEGTGAKKAWNIVSGGFGGLRSGIKSDNRHVGVSAFHQERVKGAQAAEDVRSTAERNVNRVKRTFAKSADGSKFFERVDKNFFNSSKSNANYSIERINKDSVTTIDVETAKIVDSYIGRIKSRIDEKEAVKQVREEYERAKAQVTNKINASDYQTDEEYIRAIEKERERLASYYEGAKDEHGNRSGGRISEVITTEFAKDKAFVKNIPELVRATSAVIDANRESISPELKSKYDELTSMASSIQITRDAEGKEVVNLGSFNYDTFKSNLGGVKSTISAQKISSEFQEQVQKDSAKNISDAKSSNNASSGGTAAK